MPGAVGAILASREEDNAGVTVAPPTSGWGIPVALNWFSHMSAGSTSAASAEGSASPFGARGSNEGSRRAGSFVAAKGDIFHRIATSQWFESLIGLIIVGNCVTMGIQADQQMGKMQKWKIAIDRSEHFFTTMFLIEFLLRLKVFGWISFLPHKSVFNFLDAQLVLVTGVLATWIMPVLSSSENSFMRTLSVLRAIRLVRLVRVVRKVEAFHEVYVLLRGLTESVRTLMWTVVVITFLTYVFAVFGVVLMSVELKEQYENGKDGSLHPDKLTELVRLMAYLDGVFPTMYTLIQVLTEDSWNSFSRPLQDFIPWSFAYWYFYLAFALVVLMNLVTAIIVDNALSHSKKDEEKMLMNKIKWREKELQRFRSLFEMMDEDGDGQLSWDEFEMSFESPEIATKLRLLDFEPEDCREVFLLLDTGDNLLSLEEFFEGIQRMQGNASAKDLFRVTKTNETILACLQCMSRDVSEDMQKILQQQGQPSRPRNHEDLKKRARQSVRVQNSARGRSSTRSRTPIILDSKEESRNSTRSRTPNYWDSKESQDPPETPCAETPAARGEGFSLKQSLEAAAAPEVSERVDSLNKKVDECGDAIKACNEGVQDCQRKVDLVVAELADLRRGMNALLQMAGAGAQPNPFQIVSNGSQASTFQPSMLGTPFGAATPVSPPPELTEAHLQPPVRRAPPQWEGCCSGVSSVSPPERLRHS